MAVHQPPPEGFATDNPAPDLIASPARVPSWSQRFGERHRPRRIVNFPEGIAGPTKVRLYWRHDHYVLQWWDPAAKATLSDRVNGDLVAAIAHARQIEERLTHFKSSGHVSHRRLNHADLVKAFLMDLQRRADAGDIDPATVQRYASALRHYRAFCEQMPIPTTYPYAASVDREFRLQFASFLARRHVSPNGRDAGVHPMKGQRFVIDTVRALFEWALDPERGRLLPAGFRNPFVKLAGVRSVLHGDLLGQPDITQAMAVALIQACDSFQLALFMPFLLFGLRAAEPCYLFVEYLQDDWLTVPCNPELDYRTKGRRDKRFPLLEELQPLWKRLRRGRSQGLLYERRSVVEGREKVKLRGASLAEVVAEFRGRCSSAPMPNATERKQLRDEVLRDAGAICYDHVEREFAALARRLAWPRAATLKDLRHLFATTMHNGSMPEAYRRYLMGQSPSREAIGAYTHLNELRRHYACAVQHEWQTLLAAIQQRLLELAHTKPG